MTTEDQDKAIQALMASEGYASARVRTAPTGVVYVYCVGDGGASRFYAISDDGYVAGHGYPAHEDVTP
jgi:hypothetical protein